MNSKYVWYACFGSNLNKDRFLCYIQGGKPKNSSKTEVGCRDKSLPIADEQMIFDLPLYFAKNAPHWNNGGSCILGHSPMEGNKTFGRKYLITAEQFVDIVRQENKNFELELDFDQIIEKGSMIISDKLYSRIFFVGYHENYPIFSFTAADPFGVYDLVKPDKVYLKTIISGLQEIYTQSYDELVTYLLNKPGVKEFYTFESLKAELEQV